MLGGRLTIAIIALCGATMTTGAQHGSPNSTDSTIRRLEERWRVAQQANDTTAFRELLAPDLTFIGTSGSLRDRDGYIGSRSGSWIPRATQFTVDELRLRSFGSIVIVTGRGATKGPGVEAAVRFTDVWARRDNEWMLVAIQRTDVAR